MVYDDAEGYKVLSALIELRTKDAKVESVAIFRRTIAQQTVSELLTDCTSKIPAEFQIAGKNLEQSAKIRRQLQREFSIRERYQLVGNSVGNSEGVFSFSVVGFDEARNHAIALLEYLVHPTDSIMGGDSTFYLLRKTENGWQQAAEVPKCGRIY